MIGRAVLAKTWAPSFESEVPANAPMKIETERLEPSTAAPADAEVLVKLFAVPEVPRFLPAGPTGTLDRAKNVVERRITSEAERGYSLMIVRTKRAHEFIGNAGLQPIPNTPEIGIAYHYLPSFWGHGYGTEAAIAVLRHGLGSLGLDRIIAICVAENVASWRVMEKAGMRYAGLASYYGLDGLKKYVAEHEHWRAPQRKR